MKLPKYILKSLAQNKTSLGEHPCYPPDEEEKFIIRAMERTFTELCDNLSDKVIDEEKLRNKLSKILSKCIKAESEHTEELEQLCAKIVMELFNIPDVTLEISCRIVDHIDTKQEQMFPMKTDDYSFDSIADMKRLTDEVYKRRMMNALVSGCSMMFIAQVINYIRDIFEINPDLPSLYKYATDINNVLLYIQKDIDNFDTQMTDAGNVDVTVSPDNVPMIDAKGITFVSLLAETVKGVLELSIAHGLPEKQEEAQYVISKSDFKLADVWDARLGFCLWEELQKELDKVDGEWSDLGVNFIFMYLAELPSTEFFEGLQEVFGHTRHGSEFIKEMLNDIRREKEKSEFDNHRTLMNEKHPKDNDLYWTPEELLGNE